MNPGKKESNPGKSADAVETPVPPQHMDPSKEPKTEKKERKPGAERKKQR